MISITKLWCDENLEHDALRYGIGTEQKSAAERKPIVVWSSTRTCNLNCIHCYSESTAEKHDNELSTAEGKMLIDDLSDFKVPSLLFSGGEPLMRNDIFDLIEYSTSKGLRTVLSTNGTLINEETAQRLKKASISYVGISLDGIGEKNDEFRGKAGAFEKTKNAFKYCFDAELRVGLRLTLTQHNFDSLNSIFDFIDENSIPRVCFYHLAYSGRGEDISQSDLSAEQTREAVDLIIDKADNYAKKGIKKDILTVGNHVDGVYMYRKMLNKDEERAKKYLSF